MKFFTSLVAVAATLTAVFAATLPEVRRASANPNEGDVTFQKAAFELHLYSEPAYQGEVVRLEPLGCTSLLRHSVDVNSIKYSGNNCCLFFPTTSCDYLNAGQRIVGNVRDTGMWGFPQIAAVKCLSHSACEVIRHQVCDYDAACARASEQGRCPFERSCGEYYPVEPLDFHNYAAPKGWNPVKARFSADNGETSGSDVDIDEDAVERQHLHSQLHDHGKGRPPIPAEGGTDNYDNFNASATATAFRPVPTTKKQVKKLKKDDKKREKEAKKLQKEYEKADRNEAKLRERLGKKAAKIQAEENKKVKKAQKAADKKPSISNKIRKIIFGGE